MQAEGGKLWDEETRSNYQIGNARSINIEDR
jgi:hypothetical protein